MRCCTPHSFTTLSVAINAETVRMSNLCKISYIPSLIHLQFGIHLVPVICHGKDGISTVQSRLDLIFRIDVGGNTFDTLGCQGLGVGLGRVTGDAADLEFAGSVGVAQDGFDDRTTLISGGAKDDENLLFSHDGEWRMTCWAGDKMEGTWTLYNHSNMMLAGKCLVAALSGLGPFLGQSDCPTGREASRRE